nr:hypothetical protein [Burkholderia ubonensis]
MNASTQRPPFAGNTFEVRYAGLTAINAYADDGVHISPRRRSNSIGSTAACAR